MSNLFLDLSSSQAWQVSAGAATKALIDAGYQLTRLPGRGRSNVYTAQKGAKSELISVRTTRGRKFAFPSINKGKAWLTLDDVDSVVVAAVNDRKNPETIEVYKFDAAEVRQRFSDAYSARTNAGMSIRDNFGLWVSLDKDNRDLPRSVGTGLGDEYPPIAVYSIGELVTNERGAASSNSKRSQEKGWWTEPSTIAEVMQRAKQRISSLAGVEIDAVKLDLKIES